MERLTANLLCRLGSQMTVTSMIRRTFSNSRIWHQYSKSSNCLESQRNTLLFCSKANNIFMAACPSCWVLHRSLHTSANFDAGKARNTKKKVVKPIHFNKSQKGTVVAIRHNLTVQELADILDKDADHVFEVMLYIKNTDRYDSEDSVIDDFNVIKEVVRKSGFKFRIEEKKQVIEKENKDAFRRPPPTKDMLKRRPPVVTIMGHVDHGKTTLLDALRHSNMVAQEFGGITQHIGAFQVQLPSGESITFLDTPGHAAFSAMRHRGAMVTDIVVLVVAADDGVMKQTIESVKHAQEAGVPIIVAVNKVDKPEADVEKAKQELVQLGLEIEDHGGDIQVVPVSALKGINIDALQDAITALAEVQELSADPSGLVEGTIVESKTSLGRGKLSTALIQRGTLRKGSVLVAGTAWAKVRGMFNDQGRPVTQVEPGMPVEIIGWRELPSAGDDIFEVESEHRAREVIHWRVEQEKLRRAEADKVIIQQKMEEHNRDYHEKRQAKLDRGHRSGDLYRRERTKEIIETYHGPELAIVLKGDVDGTVEAILDQLDSYQSDQCRLHLLHYGVGDISDHDIDMASTFNGICYGFNVSTTASASKLARAKGVQLENHNIIYRLFESLQEELSRRLPPKTVEEIIGVANVLQLFIVTEGKKKIPVAGSRCSKGILQRKNHFKLIRNGEVLLEDTLSSLRHFKNEVDSIKTDVECGISFHNHEIEPQPGDQIICYEMKEVPQDLDWELEWDDQ